MNEAFKKIIERLEHKINHLHNVNWNSAMEDAIEIVKKVAAEYSEDINVTTNEFIFTKEDVKKIIDSKKRRLNDLKHCWNEFTRHMEYEEIRELKESCVDDEIMIHILSEWLLKDVTDINVGKNNGLNKNTTTV